MMRPIKKGSVDQSVVIRIVDSTDGTPETGVAYNTSGIDLWYRREGATKTSITEATLAALNTAHSDGGFLHIGDGYYRVDLPDSAVASGADGVMVGGTVTGMVVIGCYVPLVDNLESDTKADTASLLGRLNAARAGYLDNLNVGGVVASAANLATTDARLDTEIPAIKARTDLIPNAPAAVSDIPSAAANASAVWASGTRTLSSYGTLVSDIWAAVADSAGVTTLLGRLTAIRGGYLDNLSGGAVALQTSLQALITTIGASAAGVAAAVWGAATRRLSDGTNIVLAKGTGVTGFNDLNVVQINTEVDNALADVGLTTTITGRMDAAISTRATPAQVKSECDTALSDYDAPTKAELDAAVAPLATAASIGGLNNLSSAQVTAAAASAIATYDPPTKGELDIAIGALNNLSQAQAQSAAAAALTTYDPPTKAELDTAVAPLATASALATTDGRLDSEIPTIITHLADIKGAGFIGATDSLEAIRERGDVAWIAESTGNGDILVDHNYGVTDAMRFTWGGVGVDGARIRAYVKTDYIAGDFNVVGSTTTNDDGRWLLPLALDEGITYTLVITAEGYETKTHEVTI